MAVNVIPSSVIIKSQSTASSSPGILAPSDIELSHGQMPGVFSNMSRLGGLPESRAFCQKLMRIPLSSTCVWPPPVFAIIFARVQMSMSPFCASVTEPLMVNGVVAGSYCRAVAR